MAFADNVKVTLAHKFREGKRYWNNVVHSHWASITNTCGALQSKNRTKNPAVNMAVWMSLVFSLGNEFMVLLQVPQPAR